MAGAPPPRTAELDFADVFGGPPRRSSGNERLSSRGSLDSSSLGSSAPRPWSGEAEAPVFGDRGSGDRRRHIGEEFYNDIFPGSDAALPRHAGAGDWGDVFGGPLSPGSTTPPRSSFSMKFNRGADSSMPTTPSRQSSHTNRDGTSYADSVQTSPNSNMNSYLAQETPQQDSRKKPFSWRHYPFLSRLRSQSGDKNNASNQVSSMESEAEGTPVNGESIMANNRFHFSFYKWAGKGALLVLPAAMEEKDAAIIGLKSFPKVVVQGFDLIDEEDGTSIATGVSKCQTDYEDSKSGKYSTNSGTKEGPVPLLFDDDYMQGMKHGNDYLAESPSTDSSRRPSAERSRSRKVKEKVKDFMKIFSPQGSPKRKGATEVQDQASSVKHKSKTELQDKYTISSSEASEDVKTTQTDQSVFINVPSPMSEMQERTEKPILTAHSKMEVDTTSARKEVAPNVLKDFMKIFSPKGSPKRKVAREVENQASSTKSESETELRDKFTVSSSEASEDVKKSQKNQNAFINVPSPVSEMQERMEKPVETVNSKMEGKVDTTSARNEVAPDALKDFIKISSPEGSPKHKVAHEVEDQEFSAKNVSETELQHKTVSSSEASDDVTISQNDENAFISVPSPVSEINERMEKPILTVNGETEGKVDMTSARNEVAPDELLSGGSKDKLDNSIHHGERYIEDLDVCLVEHISMDPVHNDEEKEQRKIAESKIREWSRGKEGNIRSLLSTLQFVLWPESGWKPIPLVDVIEGAAVKKAYQKALLCLHPDKLQQRGAAMNQKYIAEKVFDILQESWKEFNSVSFG